MEKFFNEFISEMMKMYKYSLTDLAKTFPYLNSSVSPNYIVTEINNELNCVKKKLKEKEKEAEFHKTQINNKWKDLQKKQFEFLDSLKNYDSFFFENEEKFERVNKLIESEIKFQEKCSNEIKILIERNTFLFFIENQMQDSINLLKPYNNFVQKIITENQNLKNVDELINYYILLYSESTSQNQYFDNIKKNEMKHNELLQNLDNLLTKITKKNNDLYNIKKDLNRKINHMEQHEEKLTEQISIYNTYTREIVFIKQSFENIFYQLNKWKKSSRKQKFLQKLIFVKKSYNELWKRIQLARDIKYKENLSCQTDSSFLSNKRNGV